MSEIGDECPRHDDECPRHDDECPWYDDECSNSMTTSVVTEKTGVESKKEFENTIDWVKKFRRKKGRNPRIFLAKVRQDDHDRGVKVIASSFSVL